MIYAPIQREIKSLRLQELTTVLGKAVGCKINTHTHIKTAAFIYIKIDLAEKELARTLSLTIARKIFQALGIKLVTDVKGTYDGIINIKEKNRRHRKWG